MPCVLYTSEDNDIGKRFYLRKYGSIHEIGYIWYKYDALQSENIFLDLF